jgi:hypothetical protein
MSGLAAATLPLPPRSPSAPLRGSDLRLAAIIGPAIFMLGAAVGHVYQMVTAHNFAPGNAGIMFWSDVLLPLMGYCFCGCSDVPRNEVREMRVKGKRNRQSSVCSRAGRTGAAPAIADGRDGRGRRFVAG